MAFRWSRWSPRLALVPATTVTLVAFAGSIGWTIWMSLTRSRRFADYAIDWDRLEPPVPPPVPRRHLHDRAEEHGGARHRQPARHRLRLHPGGDDRSREARRRLLPHRLPLSAGRVADRHRPRLALAVQPDAGRAGLPPPDRPDLGALRLAELPRDGHVRHHPRHGLAGLGLLHGPDAGGAEIDQHRDLERGAPRRRQLLAPLYRNHHPDDEVHLPHLRHPALARRGEGLRHGLRHDQWRPRAIDLGAGLLHDQRLLAEAEPRLASAAAVVMLAITIAIFLPLVLLTGWQQRRQEARVQ